MFLDRWRRRERPSPPPGEDAERDPRALSVRLTLVVLAAGVFVMLPPQSGLLVAPTTDTFVRLGLFAAFVVAAALRQTGSRVPVVLGTLATAGWLVLELVHAVAHPMRGLFTLLAAIGVFTFFWPYHLDNDAPKRPLIVPAALSLAAGLQAVVLHGLGGPISAFAETAMYLVVPWVALRHLQAGRTLPRLAIFTALMPLADGVLQLFSIDSELAPIGLASPILALFHPHAGGGGVGWGGSGDSLTDVLFARPSRVLVVSFMLLCIGGTALLRLPVSAVQGLSWLDAAFTATSAVCVTGLIVVDTPNALSGFGQFALVLLIQLGGLGIMSLSAATVAVLGRRLPVSYERATADIIGAEGLAGIAPAIRLIFKATFFVEGVGAVLLFIAFLMRGEGVGSAAWRAVFTSVSAFCNAGFALQSDSLVPYAEDPFILAVVGVVIVAGGLGPVVLLAMWPGVHLQRRTLQVRLALWATALLLVVPTVLIALIEWNNTLAGLGTTDRLVNAAFQSVTLRTAGFNSIDLTQIQPATWTLMIVAMFIGGCPGSTAGGVKTTTFALFVLLVASVVRREPHVQVLGRRVSRSSVRRAAATIAVASVGALVALLTMQLTQPIALDVVFFEVISALATVGLSTGGTAELDEVGKTVIILCMFAGRVGPLTLFSFFSRTVEPRRERSLPEEPVSTA